MKCGLGISKGISYYLKTEVEEALLKVFDNICCSQWLPFFTLHFRWTFVSRVAVSYGICLMLQNTVFSAL